MGVEHCFVVSKVDPRGGRGRRFAPDFHTGYELCFCDLVCDAIEGGCLFTVLEEEVFNIAQFGGGEIAF